MRNRRCYGLRIRRLEIAFTSRGISRGRLVRRRYTVRSVLLRLRRLVIALRLCGKSGELLLARLGNLGVPGKLNTLATRDGRPAGKNRVVEVLEHKVNQQLRLGTRDEHARLAEDVELAE